ncbi:MAG: polysaccharide biosynthesis protein [Oscillospiraceae bacterium]|nr:polysaccharide biosynthesis protein [Oscillospiraceae bacterium]
MNNFFERLKPQRLLLLLFDIIIVNGSFTLSLFLQYGYEMPREVTKYILTRFPIITVIFISLFLIAKLYNNLWRYMSFYELLCTVFCAGSGTVILWAVDFIGQNLQKAGILDSDFFERMPYAVYIYSFLLICFFSVGIRMFHTAYRTIASDAKRRRGSANKRIMIIGAGDMGSSIIYEMSVSGYKFGVPVAIIDDDVSKLNSSIRGIPIAGTTNDIPVIVKKFEINEIIFCIPSATAKRKREILEIAMSTGCDLKTAPNIDEFTGVNDKISEKIRDVDVLDLLARPEVKLDTEVCKYLKGQTILVTGGGGSIGSELCRQIARYEPEKIVIFDIYENNAFTLKNSLDRRYHGAPQIEIRIGSVRDIARLREVFEEFNPSSVFHAAAHKHVPLMEDSPYEAVKNNVLGTYNVCFCANEYGVKNFVLLSTDKAVNPTNVMGATKRIAELTVQHFSKISSGTKFAAVRFGNVLGSNGSVIPIFKEQIKQGGPITVTHPEITRYFMTIPEASQLVVQAGGLAKGGEIFVLDMGEPVKIVSLAENLIKLSGFEPYKDIEIQFTGLRPGEKLYEELSLEEELNGRSKTQNDKIFVTAPIPFDNDLLEKEINLISELKPSEIRDFLKRLVPNCNFNN